MTMTTEKLAEIKGVAEDMQRKNYIVYSIYTKELLTLIALAERALQSSGELPELGKEADDDAGWLAEHHARKAALTALAAEAQARGEYAQPQEGKPQPRASMVPGILQCAKCNFELQRINACVEDGNLYAGDNKTEPCPNGCGPLWQVSWEQYARQMGKAMLEWSDRAIAAEKALDASTVASVAQHSDDIAVDRFAAAMKKKLAQARAKGRSGWEGCHPLELSWMLRDHVEKGDPRDVANFCMFLWSLGKPISGIASQLALPAGPVPEGWKMVPITPTDEMLSAPFKDAILDQRMVIAVRKSLEENWGDMLSSAPSPAVAQPVADDPDTACRASWVKLIDAGRTDLDRKYPDYRATWFAGWDYARAALCQPAEEGDKA